MQTKRMKLIEDGLYELRVPMCKIAFRFFGNMRGGTLHIAYAIKKKSQKLTLRDIKAAKKKVQYI
jgi:phage-related protein